MSASLALSQGESIGDYEVVAPLRSGGMADLYLARKTGAAGFARHVAIKVVHSDLAADRSFVELFLDEARLCAQITHPNVVHVEDLGEQNGRYYLVMEYVHGCSLAELMTHFATLGRRPTLELAGHVAIKIAEGLHAAHRAVDARGRRLNVVHRDVSPQNVLLSLAGDVKLIDFGIAKAVGNTGIGASIIAGKLAYMPPEQAFGNPVDARADIYALGVILWEMLTMERLFMAHDPDTLLDRVRHPEIDTPKARVPEIPEALSSLVMSALAVDVESRLESAGELSRRLAQIVPGAASLQPSQLSALLDEVMGDAISLNEERLPSEVTGTISRRRKGTDGRAHLTDRLTQVVGPAATWAPPDSFSDRTSTAMAPVITLGIANPEVSPSVRESDPPPVRSSKAVPAILLIGALVAAGGAGWWYAGAATDQPTDEDEAATHLVPSQEAPATREEESLAEPIEMTADAGTADAAAVATKMSTPRRRSRRSPAMMRRRQGRTMGSEQAAAMMERERIDGVVIVSDFE